MEKAEVHLSGLVTLGFYTDRGKRLNNEDAFSLPLPSANEDELGTLIALGDGVGGREYGELASQEAVNLLQALYYAQGRTQDLGQRLRECVEAVNALNHLAQRREGQQRERLTTLVAAVITHNDLYVANVGDSRAYYISAQKQEMKLLTEDHSQQLQQAKLGVQLQDDHVITQAIGLEEELFVDLYHYQWQPGDYLVLVSDGLNALRPQVMAQIVSRHSPEESARQLVELAVKTDGKDNSTAIVANWVQVSSPRRTMISHQPLTWRGKLSFLLLGIAIGILLVLLFLKLFPLDGTSLSEPQISDLFIRGQTMLEFMPFMLNM